MFLWTSYMRHNFGHNCRVREGLYDFLTSEFCFIVGRYSEIEGQVIYSNFINSERCFQVTVLWWLNALRSNFSLALPNDPPPSRKGLHHRCFHVKFVKFLRTRILKNICFCIRIFFSSINFVLKLEVIYFKAFHYTEFA